MYDTSVRATSYGLLSVSIMRGYGTGTGQTAGGVGVGGTLGQHSSTPPSSHNGYGQQSIGSSSNTGIIHHIYKSLYFVLFLKFIADL